MSLIKTHQAELISEVKKYAKEFNYDPQITRITSFPEYGHELNGFFANIAPFIGSIFVFCYMFVLTWFINSVVLEKEKKIREGLFMMGLSETSMMFSWLLFYFIEILIMSLFLMIVLYILLYLFIC